MSGLAPITIVGGGLAGLCLGLGLRRRGVEVTLLESGKYPRHRVCGEFINGRGLLLLQQWELWNELQQAGASPASDVHFACGDHAPFTRRLPRPALCLSRYRLDHLLANKFVAAGGRLETGLRFSSYFGPGIVRATGRRASPTQNGYRWVGLKAHLEKFPLQADLEMHFQPEAYVGLCRVEEERVNLCGLFRFPAGANPDRDWLRWLGSTAVPSLAKRLSAAQADPESCCAVAGLSLQPRLQLSNGEFAIGDSFSMIAPVTGNGMSMALESAEAAVEPLDRYCRGEQTWEEACRDYNQRSTERFQVRLRSSWWLQRALFTPAGRMLLAVVAGRSNAAWRLLFSLTR